MDKIKLPPDTSMSEEEEEMMDSMMDEKIAKFQKSRPKMSERSKEIILIKMQMADAGPLSAKEFKEHMIADRELEELLKTA